MINPNNNYAIKIIDFGISRKFIYRDPNNRYNSIRHDMWSCTGNNFQNLNLININTIIILILIILIFRYYVL